MVAEAQIADRRLTMRRSIVALSFLCFFSSAFRFLFSRLRATRYSRARCFLSHSGPEHNDEPLSNVSQRTTNLGLEEPY